MNELICSIHPQLPQVLWTYLHETLWLYLPEETPVHPFPSLPGQNRNCVCKWWWEKVGLEKGDRGDRCYQRCNGPCFCFASFAMLVGATAFYPSLAKKIAVLANVPVLMQSYHLKRTLLALFALSQEPV